MCFYTGRQAVLWFSRKRRVYFNSTPRDSQSDDHSTLEHIRTGSQLVCLTITADSAILERMGENRGDSYIGRDWGVMGETEGEWESGEGWERLGRMGERMGETEGGCGERLHHTGEGWERQWEDQGET